MKNVTGNFFLQYQVDWIYDTSHLRICEKGRQIGLSYADSYDSVRKVAPAEAKLPSEALAELVDVPLQAVAICADLDHNVFNAQHTEPSVAEALRNTHWYELREWATRGPGQAA